MIAERTRCLGRECANSAAVRLHVWHPGHGADGASSAWASAPALCQDCCKRALDRIGPGLNTRIGSL
jgi:hypothetical protein